MKSQPFKFIFAYKVSIILKDNEIFFFLINVFLIFFHQLKPKIFLLKNMIN